MRLLSYYHPKMPVFLVYMLQQVEYNPAHLLRWLASVPKLTSVMYRKNLIHTGKAKALIVFAYAVWLLFVGLAAAASTLSAVRGICILLLSPILTIAIFYLAVLAAWLFIEQPRRKKEIAHAKAIFSKHKGVKIAIVGSYGKTTMKELLLAVLSSEKKAAATPGNQNVLISHARWARKLEGDEDILLLEYGEGAPGDIKRFAELSGPDTAIITGLAPNHLEQYKTLRAVANDLLSVVKYVPHEEIFINADDKGLSADLPPGMNTYDQGMVLGWKLQDIKVGYEGTKFIMSKAGKKITLHGQLLGRHQAGPMALAAGLALRFGISEPAIKKSLAALAPYEHRMQARQLGGAWIIDDTYNGNVEGIKAGLNLLQELPAKRKIYVTPGLVDQGTMTEEVHRTIGLAISKANPDRTILIQNSVTKYINDGLIAGGYLGLVDIVDKPLEFYTNLDQTLAAGDLIMMQNDWTDNYQ